MTTYKRAVKIVNQAYDGLITDIVGRIAINRINLRIDEAGIRSILAYILDADYYHRRISEIPADADIANFIATRLRTFMPRREVEEVNKERASVIDEIDHNLQEINLSLNEYIFQSGIAYNSNIIFLRELIQERADYNAIIAEFIKLGSTLPIVALVANLNLYYFNVQRLSNDNERIIQSIIDRFAIEIDEEESIDDISTDFSSVYSNEYSDVDEEESSNDNSSDVYSSYYSDIEAPEDGFIGLAGSSFYNYS